MKGNLMMILASSSPRRRELLGGLGYQFEVIPADIDESAVTGLSPDGTVMRLAEGKAAKVLEERPGDVVIGADTVVSVDGRILGKPAGKAEAAEMLSLLSGRTHEVYSGVCVLKGQRRVVFSVCTEVTFYPLTEERIKRYVDTGEPLDKAGAYGIQGLGALLVRKIDGDYFNVVGLPVAELCRVLEEKFDIWLI